MLLGVLGKARKHFKLSALVLVTLPGLLTAVAQYYMTNGMVGFTPIGASVIGGIAAYLLWLLVQPPKEPEASDTVGVLSNAVNLTGKVPGRTYSRRTPEELVAEIADKTEIVGMELSKRHLRQWLRITGRVRDVKHIFGDKVGVYLEYEFTEPQLILHFSAKVWGDRLNALNRGDDIVVEGKIESIRRRDVWFEDCELIE